MAKNKMSIRGYMETAFYEGVCQTKYLDSVGVQTIGIGSTRSDIPDLASWSWTKKLELQTAFDLYVKHMQKYIDGVNKALKVKVKQHQFDALVSICYNIGIAGITGSTFMKRINAGASDAQIRSGIMLWTKQKELIARRTNEANLYVNGTYVSKGRCLLFPVSQMTHKPMYAKGTTINSLLYIERALQARGEVISDNPLVPHTEIVKKPVEALIEPQAVAQSDISKAWEIFREFFTVKEK